ncbi:MAG: DUF4492 domain-containing protein, partial [Bacteroidota bacterium]
PGKIFRFYWDGFMNMKKWARTIWLIIIIKLFFMFVVLKIFFFPNKLKQDFSSDEERSKYVIEQLTTHKQTSENGEY